MEEVMNDRVDVDAIYIARAGGIDDDDGKTESCGSESLQSRRESMENIEDRKDVETSDHEDNKGLYSGNLLIVGDDMMPHGQGTMEYLEHSTVKSYSGNWKKGAWHGQGLALLKNGDSYSGEHVEGRRHGSGTYTWKDQRKYSGMFEQDWRQGQGRYTWPDGAVYEGCYVRGVRSGYGKYSEPVSGISYTGDWKDGKYHGYGVLSMAIEQGSRVYRGLFLAGKAHGHGIEIGANGETIHDGEWENGSPVTEKKASSTPPVEIHDNDLKIVANEEVHDANGLRGRYRGILHSVTGLPHGNGTLSYFSTSKDPKECLDFYEGCFDRGQYHGKGRIRWKSGDTYEGDYVNGKREGFGIYKWSDGRHYKGEFQNDMRHGEGVFVYGNRSSDWYQGNFVEGRREGKGRFVFSDGSTYDGEWKAGVYHGQGELVNSNGDTYIGAFENGVAHGYGKEVGADGELKYEGNWIHGATEAAEKSRLQREGAAASTNATTMAEMPLQQLREASTMVNTDRDTVHTEAETQFLMTTKPKSSSSIFATMQHTSQKEKEKPECVAVVDQEVEDADGHVGQYTGLISVQTQKPNGVGRIVYMDGRRIHEGFWVDGKKHGHGRCLFVPQGDFHEGEYCNNVRHGPGQYRWKDGRVFVGHYVDDQRHGKGVFTYPNGDRYEGMFENGERNGFGIFEFSNGQYEGSWKSGRYHGKGRLESSNGDVFNGYFDCGIFLREIDSEDVPEAHYALTTDDKSDKQNLARESDRTEETTSTGLAVDDETDIGTKAPTAEDVTGSTSYVPMHIEQ